MTRHEDLTVNHKILALVRKCWECLVIIQIESFNWGLTMPYLWENGRKWIQSQRCLAFLRQWSWRRLCHWWERAVFGPAQRFQKRNTICIYQAEFFVLRRGRWPRPWILWRDGGDKKRQEKVQVEEDSEKSDSTGHREARPPVYSCGFPHRPLWGVKCCTGQILYETLPQLLFSEKKKRVGPKSCSNLKCCGQDWDCVVRREKKRYSIWHIQLMHWMKCYTFEFNYHQRVPCFTKIHILTFTEVVKVTSCVSTTQLICKQS